MITDLLRPFFTFILISFTVLQVGAIGEACVTAYELEFDNCYSSSNTLHSFNGNLGSCVQGPTDQIGVYWFKFTAPASGNVSISSNADFNDVLSLYDGTCAGLNELFCSNRDEFGFNGEMIRASLVAGQEYFLRINGVKEEFGLTEGEFCMEISEGFLNLPTATNETCATATQLVPDSEVCYDFYNFTADINIIPVENLRSRASLWYSFVAPASGNVHLKSNSSYADVITVFSGDCVNLVQEGIELQGFDMTVKGLNAGQMYFVQVTGFFSAMEGQSCLLVTSLPNVPSNDQCANAVTLALGANCVPGTLMSAESDTHISSCMPYSGAAVWYKFTAPSGGTVALDVINRYPFNITVYEGQCGSFTEKSCITDWANCDGYALIGGLDGGQEYHLRFSASDDFDVNGGNFCLRLFDEAIAPPAGELVVDAFINCFASGKGELDLSIAGGVLPYTVYGNQNGDIIPFSDPYALTVLDGVGCAISISGISECRDYSLQCPNISDLSLVDYDEDFASFTWSSNGTADQYRFQYREIGTDNWTDHITTIPFVILGGLNSCTDYEARLIAECSDLQSGYEALIDFSTNGCDDCAVPGGLFSFNLTGISGILTWDIIPNASLYELEYRVQGNQNWQSYDSAYPMIILFGLPNCTTIEWRLKVACNNSMASILSPVQQFTTLNCKDGETPIMSGSQASDRLIVYPNPVKDFMVIGTPKITDGDVLIKIYDVTGRLMESSNGSIQQHQISMQLDADKYETGLYKLELNRDGESYQQIFMKQ